MIFEFEIHYNTYSPKLSHRLLVDMEKIKDGDHLSIIVYRPNIIWKLRGEGRKIVKDFLNGAEPYSTEDVYKAYQFHKSPTKKADKYLKERSDNYGLYYDEWKDHFIEDEDDYDCFVRIKTKEVYDHLIESSCEYIIECSDIFCKIREYLVDHSLFISKDDRHYIFYKGEL